MQFNLVELFSAQRTRTVTIEIPPVVTPKRPYRLGLHDQVSRREDDETIGGRRPHSRVSTWSEETTFLGHFAYLYCVVVCSATYVQVY